MMPYKGSSYNMISFLLRKPMRQRYGRSKTNKWIKDGREVYKQMLMETEDIGGDNPMAGNTYMGYVFMAIWKAADGEIKVEDFKKIGRQMMESPVVKIVKGGIDMNRKEDLDKMNAMMHRMAAWLEEHPEYKDKSWDFHFDETKHEDGMYYYFTQCPMETYARTHGFLEVLPVCCDLDHCTAKLHHAVLLRDNTLAEGGRICDYWFVGDQVKNPK